MKKGITTVLAGAALAFGASACGGGTHTTTQSQPTRTQSAQQAGTGYYNMQTLGDSIRAKVNERLTERGSNMTATDVTCILTAYTARATCAVTGSDGSSTSVGVTISTDGQRYITDGSYSGPSA